MSGHQTRREITPPGANRWDRTSTPITEDLGDLVVPVRWDSDHSGGRDNRGRSAPPVGIRDGRHLENEYYPPTRREHPLDYPPPRRGNPPDYVPSRRDPTMDYELKRWEHPLDHAPIRRTDTRPAYVLRNISTGFGNRPLQIKRMKQLEAEKDVLLQGLEAVERARDWYLAQIKAVQDKQKYVGKATGAHDYSVEAHQERMNFQHARISEVNQQLKALVESSEKGFPLHMNLALSQRVKPQSDNHESSNVVAMLKGQNRQLTQEVTEKSDKIAQLEREKATLIRDLFESRSKIRNSNYEDTTFM